MHHMLSTLVPSNMYSVEKNKLSKSVDLYCRLPGSPHWMHQMKKNQRRPNQTAPAQQMRASMTWTMTQMVLPVVNLDLKKRKRNLKG